MADELTGVVDDLMAFVAVVDAGGFNAAGARFGTPSSRLSRRVAALERLLGVSLLVRTSRRFAVTEIGWRIYERGVAIRAQTRDAVAEATESLGEPCGHLRVLCPMAMGTSIVGPFALRFMHLHPRVRITLESTDGRARPFNEPVDLMIQPTIQPLRDSSLVARKLVDAHYRLVAAPALADTVPDAPAAEGFPCFPAVGWTFSPHPARWSLSHPVHGTLETAVDVRFATDNLLLVREAALAGVGVAQLPPMLYADDVAAGRLRIVAPGWSPPSVAIHALYPSRRRLTLAGRRFVELLAQALEPLSPPPA